MRKRSLVILLVAVIALLSLSSCAPRQVAPEPQLTPLEQAEKRAAEWTALWNGQYEDHKSMSQLPGLTEDQKKILSAKREILIKTKPLLKIYVDTVRGGGMPSAASERELMDYMNQLSTMAAGAVSK